MKKAVKSSSGGGGAQRAHESHSYAILTTWILVLLIDLMSIVLLGLTLGYESDKSSRYKKGTSWLYATIFTWSILQGVASLFVLGYYQYLAQFIKPVYQFSMRMLVLVPTIVSTTITLAIFTTRLLARGDYNGVMVVSLLSIIPPLHTTMIGFHMRYTHTSLRSVL